MIEEKIVQKLIECAQEVKKNAYVPYSHFPVGAALLGNDGTIYTGCNVENSSYGVSICAERNAIFHAIACGCRSFKAIAIVSDSTNLISPCGACRQVLSEFHCDEIILTKADGSFTIVSLKDILPLAFEL